MPPAESPSLAVSAPERQPQLHWSHVFDHPVGLFLGRCAIFAALFGVWQLASGTLLPTLWFSSPSQIFGILVGWIVDGTLWHHTLATAAAAGLGYLLGAGLGIALGLFVGFVPVVEKTVGPYLTAFYSLPKVALAPLFVLVFGIGMESKIALVIITVFFPVLYSTLDGTKDIDTDLIESLQVMGAKRLEVIRIALIPGCVARIFTGLRISVRHAFTAAILGEIIAGNQGLGYLISFEADSFRSGGVLAALVVVVILSVLLTVALSKFEERGTRWRVSQEL